MKPVTCCEQKIIYSALFLYFIECHPLPCCISCKLTAWFTIGTHATWIGEFCGITSNFDSKSFEVEDREAVVFSSAGPHFPERGEKNVSHYSDVGLLDFDILKITRLYLDSLEVVDRSPPNVPGVPHPATAVGVEIQGVEGAVLM